jgi:hypothetical protein
MRFSSPLSIASPSPTITLSASTPTSTSLGQSDTSTNTSRSDDGSDTGSSLAEDHRSIIRKHISFRPRSESPPNATRRKVALSSPSTDHVNHANTEPTARSTANKSLLKLKPRSRAPSGSSLLNPSITISPVSGENSPQQNSFSCQNRTGPADTDSPTTGTSEVDNNSAIASPPTTVSFPIFCCIFSRVRLQRYLCTSAARSSCRDTW